MISDNSEVTFWEDFRGKEGPDVDESGEPADGYTHPEPEAVGS